MKAYDFEFDGKLLSSFGMIICSFDSKGLETVDGSTITFNTVSVQNGSKYELVSAVYEDCLECTIQICKNTCSGKSLEISPQDFHDLTKWLNRKNFYKLKILDKEHKDIYYEAAFTNINKIEINGSIVGLELNILTNRPYALREPKIIRIKNTVENGKHSMNDISHEEGYIYPYTEITVNQNGNLDIYNAIEDRHTVVKNCVTGEVITMDYPVIKTSNETHSETIQDDFNWSFFRIANTYDFSRNDLTISVPCEIKLEYSPIVKVGL